MRPRPRSRSGPCLLLLAALAASAPAAHLFLDHEGLRAGVAGRRAWVELPASEAPEAGRAREGLSGWTLSVGPEALQLVGVHRLGPALRLEFFRPTEAWSGLAAAAPAALAFRGTEVARWPLPAAARGTSSAGAPVLAPAAATAGPGLAPRFLPPYLQVVAEPVRQRLEALGSAEGGALWFDLGRVAERRGELVAAAYAFARAADAAPEDALPVTWLARCWLRVAPHDEAALGAIEAALEPRVEALAARATQEEAAFSEERRAVEAAEAGHRKDFDAARKRLQTLPAEAQDGAEAKALAARLEAIQGKVDAAGAALRDKLGAIARPTPAMVRALVDVRLARSRLGDERARIEQALAASELSYQGRYLVVPVDRTLRARVLLRQAAWSHAAGVPAEAAYQARPEAAELARLEKAYGEGKAGIEARRKQVDAAVAALKDAPELAPTRDAAGAAEAAYEQARAAYEQRSKEVAEKDRAFREAERAYQAKPGEATKAAAEAAMEAFNTLVPQVNELAEAANAKAEAANAANKVHAEAYEALAKARTKDFDAAVVDLNQMVDRIHTLEETLKQPRGAFRELLFRRDEALALARDELHRQLAKRPTPELASLMKSLDRAVPVPAGATRVYQGRPWCQSLSLACDTCFGLAVLGCEFAQMDARSACEKGEPYETLLDRSVGRGGMIGACRGVRGEKPEEDRWTIDPGRRTPTRRAPADDVVPEVMGGALDGLLAPTFDPDPSCAMPEAAGDGPAPAPMPEGDDEGLPLDFSEAVKKEIEAAHEKWKQDRAREARLAELRRDLDRVDEARALRQDPELRELGDALRVDPDNAALRRRFAEKLAARAAHVAEVERPGPGSSKQDWVDYAKKTNEMAKKANEIAEKLAGEKIPGLEKLTELTDQVTGIVEAAKKGDATAMQQHVGDFLRSRGVSVPYDWQMAVVGATVDWNRELYEGAAKPLDSMAEAISSDDPARREAALERMVQESQDLQKKLSGKYWAEKVKKNLLSKIPFYDKAKGLLEKGKDLVGGIVNFFSGGGECKPPPPPLSDDELRF